MMANDRPIIRAYVAVDPADICYPYEAVAWVAFGRLPLANFDSYGIETRGLPKSVADGYAPEESHLFSGDELSFFFETEEEAARYVNAKYEEPGVSSVEEYFNGKSSNFDMPRGFIHFGPRDEAGLIEARFVETAEKPINAARQRARLKVLLALMEGSISASGVRIHEDWKTVPTDEWADTFWDELKVAEPENIPSTEWTSFENIWSESPEEIRSENYLYPTLSVPDVMKVFESPDVGERQVHASQLGATLFVGLSSGKELKEIGPRRGRPPKGHGAVARAVRNEFFRRHRLGTLPDKNEAIVAEAQAWVREIFEEEIGRTTAQRYLTDLLAARK